MNFLSIGPMELILILTLALIIFGPSKLPEIGRTMGKAVREFRKVSSELTKDFTKGIEEEIEVNSKTGVNQGKTNEVATSKAQPAQAEDKASPK